MLHQSGTVVFVSMVTVLVLFVYKYLLYRFL